MRRIKLIAVAATMVATGFGVWAAAPIRALRRLRSGARTGSADRPPFWALKDVSFEVQAGEAVGIIGRNGAGKSTLLKVLSRITEPTEGGADIHGRMGSLLEVGTGFHPELTGRENVYLNGAILGMRRAEIARKFGVWNVIVRTGSLRSPIRSTKAALFGSSGRVLSSSKANWTASQRQARQACVTSGGMGAGAPQPPQK